jgi:hypothetical protein
MSQFSSGRRDQFLVQISATGGGGPVGFGVLVGDREVVTCAHVVNSALGRDVLGQERPTSNDKVNLSFPLLSRNNAYTHLDATVAAWAPPHPRLDNGEDVAGLKLSNGNLPVEARPATLRNVLPVQEKAALFGYPHNPPGRTGGGWADVALRGVTGRGYLQVDSLSDSAIRVQPGFSGTPIIVRRQDRDIVTGILDVSSKVASRDAYGLSLTMLANVWPEVMPLAVQAERGSNANREFVIWLEKLLRTALKSGRGMYLSPHIPARRIAVASSIFELGKDEKILALFDWHYLSNLLRLGDSQIIFTDCGLGAAKGVELDYIPYSGIDTIKCQYTNHMVTLGEFTSDKDVFLFSSPKLSICVDMLLRGFWEVLYLIHRLQEVLLLQTYQDKR